MPIRPIVGPAGAGKSQHIEQEQKPGDIIIDYTRLWVALTGAVRGPDGKYPDRTDDDPSLALVNAVKQFALSQAIERELDGYVTSSASAEVPKLEARTGQVATVLDPGQTAVEKRLADRFGTVSDQCRKALRRWYG